MKKCLLILAAGLFVTSARADDLAVTQRQAKQAQTRNVTIETPRAGEGAIQWVARLRNPGQAISVLAPAEFGNGSDFIDVYPEYDPSQRTPADKPRAQGIKFFCFKF